MNCKRYPQAGITEVTQIASGQFGKMGLGDEKQGLFPGKSNDDSPGNCSEPPTLRADLFHTPCIVPTRLKPLCRQVGSREDANRNARNARQRATSVSHTRVLPYPARLMPSL